MFFLSLIIPVYNVEKYLDNCIRSVIMHSPDELSIEVILIDDGSSDSSGKICDKYADEYEYIKAFHKENGGLSSARNAGMRQAAGRYIMFMDSDDWWNPDIEIRKIVSYIKTHEQTEMFLFTSYDFIENEGYYKRNEHNNLSNIKTTNIEQYYQSLLDNGNLEVSACTKILKKSFLFENKLYFREGLLSEDNEWMLRLLRKLRVVDIIAEPLYVCRLKREGSISNSIKKKNIEDLLKIIRSSMKYYEKHPQHILKKYELCYASYLWFSALGLSTMLSRKEKKGMKKLFMRTSDVCKYSHSPKTRLCYIVYKMFGLALTSYILGMYIKIKGKRQLNRTKISEKRV